MTIGVAVALAVLFEVVRKRTLFGKVGMAMAFDAETASAIGINTKRVAIGAFAVAGIFAGVGGILVGPLTFRTHISATPTGSPDLSR